MKTTRPNGSDLNIDDVIQQINTDICSAQTQLLAESGKMISLMKSTEISLPTAYRRIVKRDGESELQKISDAKVPLGSLLPTGVFYISNVEVELPILIDVLDDHLDKGKDLLLTSPELESKSQATLRLTYRYQPLSKDVSPITLQSSPFLDLRFIDFNLDPKNHRSCSAKGVIEARDEETGEPLAGAKIYLSVENGSVMPSVGNLNGKGAIEFRLIGPCDKDGEFNNSLLLLINGITRTFSILLSPEDQGQSL